jgi:PEGA domain
MIGQEAPMRRSLPVTLLLAFAATSAFASHPSGGHSSGGRYGGGGHRGGGYWGGGHAVPRAPGGHAPHGAYGRHPQPGHYGHYGYGHYGYGHYGYSHGRYPYYRYGYYYPYYGYYPYGWGWGYPFGLGLSFYYNSGGYAAPNYGYYAPDDRYSGGGGEPDRDYGYRSEPREDPEVATGRLRLRVQPDDASVYVDGEFRGMARRLGTLRLSPGRHRIEVVRPGFNVVERDVDVSPDAPASLDVELEHR